LPGSSSSSSQTKGSLNADQLQEQLPLQVGLTSTPPHLSGLS
jgi:hypothetical protein